VVFGSAGDAVAAAAAAQRGIAATGWPERGVVRIRIGIHTGTPQRHAEGYVGLDVHRGARVAAAAHGGQTLVSEATAVLTRDHLPAGASLRDRGEHGLKDIPDRVRLYQLDLAGLPHDFPPLRTLGGAGSLPALLTPTVGRDGELTELAAVLTDGARLVTLTGPGGTGKTRLATSLAGHVAASFPDGVYFVALATITSAADIWPSIARVLEIPPDGQVPPGFFDHVAARRVLLVLDNLEQIPDADDVVRDLLTQAPHLTVIATTRRPLHVEGEHDHGVPALLPDGSLQLFVEHATRARRGFALTDDTRATVAAICAHLDHLPLAVELAAARTKVLSPAAILSRIDTALDLASTDRSRTDRQRTIRGAIDWSYQLLSPAHQSVLDHLGIFEGGADLAALHDVVPAAIHDEHDVVDLAFDLVDTSLAHTTEGADGEPRLHLLETIKQYARDQLAARDQLDSAATAHAQHFYDRCVSWYERLQGPADARLESEFRAETANLRAACERGYPGVTHPEHYSDQTVPPLRATALLAALIRWIEWWSPAYGWLIQRHRVAVRSADTVGELAVLSQIGPGLARIDDAGFVAMASALLAACAGLEVPASSPEWADPAVREADLIALVCWSLAAEQRFDEARALARNRSLRSPAHERVAELEVLKARYYVAYFAGEYDEAREHQLRIMSLGHQNRTEVVLGYNNLYCLDLSQGRLQAAQRGFTEAVTHLRDDDVLSVGWISLAESFALTVGTAHPLLCARVYAATGTLRVVEGYPQDPALVAEDEADLALLRPLVSADEWARASEQGRSEDVRALLRELAALPLLPPDENLE
jgi:predicted ATPase